MSKKGGSSIVRLKGKCLLTVVVNAAVTATSLTPAISNRLTALSDVYSLFRFTHLRMRPLRVAQAATGTCALSYNNSVVDANPATATAIVEMDHSTVWTACNSAAVGPVEETHPIPPVVVPRSFLLGGSANKFWKSKLGATDDWHEVQGQIFIIGPGATHNEILEVWWEIEFASPVGTAQTPRLPLTPAPSMSCHSSCAYGQPTRDIEEKQNLPKGVTCSCGSRC